MGLYFPQSQTQTAFSSSELELSFTVHRLSSFKYLAFHHMKATLSREPELTLYSEVTADGSLKGCKLPSCFFHPFHLMRGFLLHTAESKEK